MLVYLLSHQTHTFCQLPENGSAGMMLSYCSRGRWRGIAGEKGLISATGVPACAPPVWTASTAPSLWSRHGFQHQVPQGTASNSTLGPGTTTECPSGDCATECFWWDTVNPFPQRPPLAGGFPTSSKGVDFQPVILVWHHSGLSAIISISTPAPTGPGSQLWEAGSSSWGISLSHRDSSYS